MKKTICTFSTIYTKHDIFIAALIYNLSLYNLSLLV